MPRPASFNSLTSTSRSCDGYGNGRSKTASTTLKMAVEAPMPSASVRMATMEKLGRFDNERSEYLKSAIIGLMTNSECRMTKECPNDEGRMSAARFDIRASSLIRHSTFVLRHFHYS